MSDSPAQPVVEILPFAPERAEAFDRINRAWIEEMFSLEEIDRQVLENPQTHILDPGGDILFVSIDGKGIVGAGALKPFAPGVIELTKMGVTTEARGHKAGEALLHALIARAEELGAKDLVLLTNSKCDAAIHLYKKAGFVHSEAVSELFGATYSRCNVSMRYGGVELQYTKQAS